MREGSGWEKRYFVARLLYMTFGASLFISALVVELLTNQLQSFPNQIDFGLDYSKLRYLFYGMAVIMIVSLRILRGTLLKKAPLHTTAIITAAFCESPAIFGLVLFLLTGMKRDFHFLSIISLFLLFMYFPRHSHWEEESKQH
jgi:hypothetical protein